MEGYTLMKFVICGFIAIFSLFGLIVAIDPKKISSFSIVNSKSNKKVTIQPTSFFMTRAMGIVFFVMGALLILVLLTS